MRQSQWGRRSPWSLLVIASAAILTTGGAVYGWSSLSLLLEREGEFGELCTPHDSGCAEQRVAFDRIFTVSTSTMVMLFFTSGMLLDLIGPRQLCMLGAAVYALGCYLMAISKSRGPNLYILAYSMLAWGGPAIFLSFIPLSALYGRWSHTVLCGLNSAFDATPYLFSLFQLIAQNTGATHTTIFAVYSAIPLSIALSAPFLWADSAAEYRRPAADAEHSSSEDARELSGADEASAQDESWRALFVAVKGHALTGDYAWLLAITASGLVRINFYLGTVELQLRRLVPPDQSWVWVDVFSLTVILGAIAAIPVGGRLLRHGRLVASVGLLSVWLLFNVLSLVPHIAAQVAAFIVLSLFRPFFYSCVSSFMSESFGFKHFGFLYGFASLVGAAVSFLQWPIVGYTERRLDGDFLPINAAFLLLQLPLVFYPFYVARSPLHKGHEPLPTDDQDAT